MDLDYKAKKFLPTATQYKMNLDTLVHPGYKHSMWDKSPKETSTGIIMKQTLKKNWPSPVAYNQDDKAIRYNIGA